MSEKTLIIGGVAGGATAGARLRRKDEAMEIIIFERGDYISYANCGLPYYIGGVIKEREALLLQTPEAMKNKYNIDVRTNNEVTKILPDEKMVKVKNLKTSEEYEESYDNLIIATGSSPIVPTIPGINEVNVFTLWNVPDTDKVKTFLNEHNPKSAVVIGGGFIGLEMAENLKEAGLDVSLIEMQSQVMAPMDHEMANLIHENLIMNDINLILNDGVRAFANVDNHAKVILNSGQEVICDLVVLSIGVRPNSELARESGIEINEKGGIKVDEYLQTSKKNIYAAGDVIEVNRFSFNDKTMIPLAGPANKQARIVADNITMDKKEYKGSMGTAVAKIFDLDAASVGLNEKQLKAQGMVKNKDYFTVLINQKSHAGYYPGATAITLKAIFDKTGKILGAQVIGQEGVDKSIDIISSVIRLNGKIQDLTELELSYAPPFSSAKAPVNMLGFVAENLLNGLVSFVEWDELDQMLEDKEQSEKVIVLDVTENIERELFSIPGSYHIPLGQVRSRFKELDKDKKIIVYCAIGVRAYNGARILMQNGFNNVSVMSGGVSFYKSMHYDIKKKFPKPETKEPDKTVKIDEDKDTHEIRIVDCCGLQCPGPIVRVNEEVIKMQENEIVKVSATDMGFVKDIEAWCKNTGNTLVKSERHKKENIVYIRKGKKENSSFLGSNQVELPQGKTIIVFSGDLDKVLASFIIANGAAAMGRPVTMFFTFWGLNALRKNNGKPVSKPFMDKMFGSMMPKGANKLKLSNMNMGGMGTAMMKKVMNDKNVDSLETLMKQAMKSGIKLVACTMSMDVMGLKKEELIDGIEYAGVASYLGDAENSNVNLFI